MHSLKILPWCIVGMLLCAGASAQIYESKDAQGNTVYSDKPSQGAETVKLPRTNSADPVAERPRPPADTAEETSGRGSSQSNDEELEKHGAGQADGEYEYYGGTYNNNQDDSRSERRANGDTDRPDPDRPHVDHHDSGTRAAAGTGARAGTSARAGARAR